jgi:hypothetical protein
VLFDAKADIPAKQVDWGKKFAKPPPAGGGRRRGGGYPETGTSFAPQAQV